MTREPASPAPVLEMHDQHQRHAAGIVAAVRSLRVHRQLIFNLVVHDFKSRYRGSFAGLLWTVLLPLLMLAAYVLVFGFMFTPRWNSPANLGEYEFALFVLAGLVVFNFVSEVAGRAGTTVVENVNYVKKAVFPLEVLPVVRLGHATVQLVVATGLLLAAVLITAGRLPLTVLFVPLVLAPLLIAMIGLAWGLAATGVFVRDIGQLVGPLLALLMFLSPVFYPVSAVPGAFRTMIELGPLSVPIEQLRRVVLIGSSPDWGAMLLYAGASMLLFWVGFFWFQRTRRGFADVL